MNGKELTIGLKKGEYIYGTAILSPSPIWPEIVSSLDLDMIFIDTEHTPLNRETVSWMCCAYSALNLAPVVRISSPDPYKAAMVLDGGATGVIAPYIETAEEVRQLVAAVKHKPVKGKKLQENISEQELFEPDLSDYLNQINQENILIVNIESVSALEALDEILSVEGLDAVLVGPHDLSCSLGIPEEYNHSLFIQSVDIIIKKARPQNVGVGIHTWDAVGFDQEILWAKKGANLIMHSSDLLIFRNSMRKDIQRIKESLDKSSDNKQTTSFNS